MPLASLITLTYARWEDAHRYYDLALALEPNNKNALVDKGRAFSEQSRLPEALGAFTRAREIDPKDADIHYNISGPNGFVHTIDKVLLP